MLGMRRRRAHRRSTLGGIGKRRIRGPDKLADCRNR